MTRVLPRSAAEHPERQLALLLVGTRAWRECNRARIDELISQADFAALESFLLRDPMLTLIGGRLLELYDAVPERFTEEVERCRRLARRQGVYQAIVTARLMAALTGDGVRVLPLKGPLLAERIYGKLEARVSADIDLLVDRSDLDPAIQTLGRLGYRSPFDAKRHDRRPEVHELLRSVSGLPEIELHWRVHWYDERFGSQMLRRADVGEDGWLRPQPADELAGLLLSYARDGFAGLRRLADITGWWDRYGESLQPGELDELAASDPAIAGPLATSAVVAERLGGLPAQRLLGPELLSRTSQLATRLANWALRGPDPQISADRALVDWSLAGRGQRRALLGRHLWPSEEVLRLRCRNAGPDPPQLMPATILRMRLLHMVRVCGRYAIALGQVRTGGSVAPAPSWLNAGADGSS